MNHCDRSQQGSSAQSSISLNIMEPQHLLLHEFNEQLPAWVPVEHRQSPRLDSEAVVKVVSWNLDGLGPICAGVRASAAMEHLRLRFGEAPGHLVIMLQEVTSQSLRAMQEHPWVRRNFVLSNIEAPSSLYKHIPGETFIMRKME